jgi:hypothetical protein
VKVEEEGKVWRREIGKKSEKGEEGCRLVFNIYHALPPPASAPISWCANGKYLFFKFFCIKI